MSAGAASVARPAWMDGDLPAPIRTLVAIGRTGAKKSRRIVWLMRCTVCHTNVEVVSNQLASGKACCPECVPNVARAQEKAILAMLPATHPEIIARLGLTKAMVHFRTTRMRGKKMIHIGGWRRTESVGGSYQPVFKAGDLPNVPCPFRPLSTKTRTRRYVKKLKETVAGRETMERRRARTRALYYAKKMQKTGDPLVMALFGKATAKGGQHDEG